MIDFEMAVDRLYVVALGVESFHRSLREFACWLDASYSYIKKQRTRRSMLIVIHIVWRRRRAGGPGLGGGEGRGGGGSTMGTGTERTGLGRRALCVSPSFPPLHAPRPHPNRSPDTPVHPFLFTFSPKALASSSSAPSSSSPLPRS